MTYSFSVVNGYLSCSNSRKTIISDMVNIHVATFTLDSSWVGYDKTATFLNTKTNVKKDIVLGTETLSCLIPWETLVAESEGGYLVVGLSGYKDGKILRTKMLNPLLIEKSDIDNGDNPLSPTPDVYEQIMDLIASLGGAYVLPNASATTLGGIKVGNNLSIDVNGVLNAESGGTSDYALLSNKPSVNGVTLSGNKTTIDLGITIPTKTSDLSNDSNFIVDSNYVHTDNNYTTTEKNKLSGIVENANNYSLPIASNSVLGGIKVGTNLSIDENGILSASDGGGGSYTLPVASDGVLGGIKIGNGLSIDGSGTVTPSFPVTSVNTKTGVVSLTTDDVSATTTNRYVPSIPLVTPETKYLNGNGEFSDIVVSSSGYINNIYLSNVNSDVNTYKTLSYAIDLTEFEKSTTVSSGGGEVLSGVYLYPSAIGIDTINSGAWSIDINAKVSSISGGSTVLRYEFFVRRADNTEVVLFSEASAPIKSTIDYELSISTVSNQVFSILATDRLGIRIYASTTRVSSTIVSYIIGGGRGSYFTIPLALRHSQLREKNEEENFQHITTAQKIVLGNTSGTNTGDETNSTILSKIGYTPENIANKGQALGYCSLDGGGKVPLSNLPATLLKYVGVWNASTNTPTLTNPDTTKIGNVYNVSVAGTQFGINFSLGDWLIYNSSGIPEKSDNSDDVVSVNSKTGNVVLTTTDIADSNDKRYVTETQISNFHTHSNKTVLDNTTASYTTEDKTKLDTTASDSTAHISNTSNPHGVSKIQVGLGNVDNVQQYSSSNPPPIATTSVSGTVKVDGTTIQINDGIISSGISPSGKVLLWTNSSPTTSRANGYELIIDLEPYSEIEVLWADRPSENQTRGMVRMQVGYTAMITRASGVTIQTRTLNLANLSKVVFGDCTITTIQASPSVVINNNQMMPLKIWGIA